jgi:hypothetical protein
MVRVPRSILAMALCLVAGRAWAGSFASHDRIHALHHRDPPAARTPVILVHGWGFGNALTFTGLRYRLVQEVSEGREPGGLEVYEYTYDHGKDYRVLARELVADVEALLGKSRDPSARRPVLIGYSAGGILARYAMDEPGFGARVAGLITVASPLHGCLGATMLYGNERLREDLGEEAWATILETREDMEFADSRHMLHTLGFDNLGPAGPDGAPRDLLPQALLERWGLAGHVNQRLRRINVAGRWDHLVHPHMGRNQVFETVRKESLGRRQRALYHRILVGYSSLPVSAAAAAADADPIVAVYSGTLAFRRRGRPLGSPAQLYEGMTHIAGAVRAELQEAILGQLRAIRVAEVGPPPSTPWPSRTPSFGDLLGAPGGSRP